MQAMITLLGEAHTMPDRLTDRPWMAETCLGLKCQMPRLHGLLRARNLPLLYER